MVMEKPSPLLVGREFVRQYYTLLNKAPDFLHRFYGRNSSYVHGGLDSSGKLAEAVYGQAVGARILLNANKIYCKLLDYLNELTNHICHYVHCMILSLFCISRKITVGYVLQGSAANKFYVHNDIFRYEDEVFEDSEAELDEESEEEVEEEAEERQPSPEPLQESPNSTTYYEPHPVANGVEEAMEEPVPEPEPEPEPEPKVEDIKPEIEEKVLEEMEEKAPSPVPVESPPNIQEPPKTFSWASVTSKNLPPTGSVPSSGIPPHVVKVSSSQPRAEAKPETQNAPLRPRDQRTRDRLTFTQRGPRPGGRGEAESGDVDNRRIVRYPDTHQLFVGNLPHDIDENELKDFFMTYGNVLELRINTKGVGGKLPNFGFVVFDDSEPVQKILGAKPIMFRNEVRLNVEEKKTRAVREREIRNGEERRDMRRNDRGAGGSRSFVPSGMMRDRDGRGPPPRGGMAPKMGTGSGRGAGVQGEGRFTTQRR
uniref:G3BP stress granule assembly factor 2 n=1 Tax=Tetraodon nigroviridis TaxID=99883 RepID=H3D0E4_TETNG